MMETLTQFEKFLSKKRKKNGDKLLLLSIKRYTDFVSEYFDDLQKLKTEDSIIEFMNLKIKQRQSALLYSSFRNYLLFIGYEESDPIFSKIKAPERRANSQNSVRFLQSKILSRQELRRLFNEVEEEWKLIFSFLYDTACRRSEMLSVKWGDINFIKNPTNNIYAEVNILGKGQKARTVYLGKITTRKLIMYRNGAEDDEKIFIFYSDEAKKKPVKEQANYLYKKVHKMCFEILGRNVSPHAIRRSSATHLADRGADVMMISAILGHTNVQTSMIYIKISSHVSRQAFENHSKEIIEGEDDG